MRKALRGTNLRLQRPGALLPQVPLAPVLLAVTVPALWVTILFVEYSHSCPALISEETEQRLNLCKMHREQKSRFQT